MSIGTWRCVGAKSFLNRRKAQGGVITAEHFRRIQEGFPPNPQGRVQMRHLCVAPRPIFGSPSGWCSASGDMWDIGPSPLPQRYIEKYLWRKLFDHDPRFTKCADKLRAKAWVCERHPGIRVPEILREGRTRHRFPTSFFRAMGHTLKNVRRRHSVLNMFQRWGFAWCKSSGGNDAAGPGGPMNRSPAFQIARATTARSGTASNRLRLDRSAARRSGRLAGVDRSPQKWIRRQIASAKE